LERPGPEQVEGLLGYIGAARGRDEGAVRVSRGGVWEEREVDLAGEASGV
jgi:hypothetical protein